MPTLVKMRRDLLEAARNRATVTYGLLMKRYGLSRGRRLSQVIGEIDEREYCKGAPGFAAIIVRKGTGLPGGGYFCDDELPSQIRRQRGRASDPRLSRVEMTHVREQQKKIWNYYGKC